MSDRLVDRHYLTEIQYASDANLSSRQAIYRFQQPRVRTAEWALDLAGLSGTERVLDAGCGNGLHLGELTRRKHRGAVYGVDLSPGMLAAARTRSDATLIVGDAQYLPFADASIDCLLAMHMLYHVPDRHRALREIRRVLRPDGVALAITNSVHHLEQLNALIGSVVHDVVGGDANAARAYLRFSSESGGAELSEHFGSVQRHDARSELVVTEVEPVVAYVASMAAAAAPVAGTAQPVLREVDERTRAVIAAEGALRISTDVGCFVCR